jgi:hypothetical protein
VKEEVYYREAVKLGLDGDDTVVRRRMQQKMEFLIEPPEEALQASDEALQSFLEAHRERFQIDPSVAFRQIFVRSDKGGEAAAQRAPILLAALRSGTGESEVGAAGDPTLLPEEMELAPLHLIARRFGEDFAAALPELPVGEWRGPIASPYGLHLVRVESVTAGYVPTLEEVRGPVLQEWQHEKREAYAEAVYRRLLEGYEVILPDDGAPDLNSR